MIQRERIRSINGHGPSEAGEYAVYWMQRSQRAEWNHALEYCIERAGRLGVPPVVLFVLTAAYPEANLRHYHFMLEGLAETAQRLRRRGIPLILRVGDPVEEVAQLCRRAALCICDGAYTRVPRRWRGELARRLTVSLEEVESDLIVPVTSASPKEEYTAGTFRPKIHRRLPEFLQRLERRTLRASAGDPELAGEDPRDTEKLLEGLNLDRGVAPVSQLRGGASEAERRLDRFVEERLERYEAQSNDPAVEGGSGLAPYLHFGQISPLEIALRVLESDSPGKDAFLEQLVVRRELSFNFTWYDPHYDSLEALPDWAKGTLRAHADDVRPKLYTPEQLEGAATGDPYWNAAQRELRAGGRMHGYMRMYWGKKILEWSPTPEEAYARALYLNNRYALDGRDPNSFAGIAWCFGKHDRAWSERAIFGKVRYMNARGLERKFDMRRYLERVEAAEG